MASKADIVNLAYSHLGHTANVINIDPPDPSNEAKKAAIFYPIALAEALADHDWGFATRYETLSDLGTPVAGWAFRFSVPSDYLQALEFTENDFNEPQPYKITTSKKDGTVIHSNVSIPLLKYISLVTVTGRFPPKFVNALSWLLASYLAGPIKRAKPEDVEKLRKVYREALGEGAVRDANAEKTSSPRQRVENYKPRAIRARA